METNGTEYLTFTEQNFHSQVLQHDQPVLVDFWAPWCGPCRTMNPIISELASEWEGKVTIGKVNVDQQPQLAAEYRIQSIPTFLILHNGQLKETLVGAIPKKLLIEKFQAVLEAAPEENKETVS